VLPAVALATGGVTLTEIGGVTVIVAVSDAVVSDTEVAVSVTANVALAEAGAVYVMAVPLALDAADKLPHGVGPVPVQVQVRPVDESDQFTPPIFGSLLTVGVNVIPVGLLAATFTVLGVIETPMLFVSVMVACLVTLGVTALSVASKITIAGFVTPVPARGITFGAVYVTPAPFAVPLLMELTESVPHVEHATEAGAPPAPC
jgi:hypothetical protein